MRRRRDEAVPAGEGPVAVRRVHERADPLPAPLVVALALHCDAYVPELVRELGRRARVHVVVELDGEVPAGVVAGAGHPERAGRAEGSLGLQLFLDEQHQVAVVQLVLAEAHVAPGVELVPGAVQSHGRVEGRPRAGGPGRVAVHERDLRGGAAHIQHAHQLGRPGVDGAQQVVGGHPAGDALLLPGDDPHAAGAHQHADGGQLQGARHAAQDLVGLLGVLAPHQPHARRGGQEHGAVAAALLRDAGQALLDAAVEVEGRVRPRVLPQRHADAPGHGARGHLRDDPGAVELVGLPLVDVHRRVRGARVEDHGVIKWSFMSGGPKHC